MSASNALATERVVRKEARKNEIFSYTPDGLSKLTIGGLLMRLHRLALLANLLSDEQREILTRAQQVESAKRECLVAYTNKTTNELLVRINAWDQFLNDCTQNQ